MKDPVLMMNLSCEPHSEVPSRLYGWNFSNLVLKLTSKTTVEFRRPPGATTPDEAISWAEFTVVFVHSACRLGDGAELKKFGQTVEALLHFISGSSGDEMSHVTAFRGLFDGKSGMMTPESHATNPWHLAGVFGGLTT